MSRVLGNDVLLKFSHDRLQKRKEELLEELESLESDYEQGKIPEKQYKTERNRLERDIVVTMDRLVQLGSYLRNL